MRTLERIRACADASIRRALGFATLGIWTAMVGMSAEPFLAVKSGAVLITGAWAVLLLMAWRAPRRPYKRTEVWLMLDRSHGLPEAQAQKIIGGVLKDRYVWHASATAAVACFMWVATFAVALTR